MGVTVKCTEFAQYRDEVEDCPTHPKADKYRVYEEKRYVLNGIESHTVSRKVTGYECVECGRSLPLCMQPPCSMEEGR